MRALQNRACQRDLALVFVVHGFASRPHSLANDQQEPRTIPAGYTLHMINGAHVIIQSKDAEADRAFFRDVLKYPSVDAGHGWLIFALPPAELAVHPSGANDAHELFLMCDDVHTFVADMTKQQVPCSPVDEQRWGSITRVTLPGGGTIGVYQPKHASPINPSLT